MTNFKYIIILILSIIFVSCEKNLMENIESGSWNSERGILNIKFSNQLGTANISRDSIGVGKVNFYFMDTLKSGNMNLEITEMNLSYGASADKKAGDILSFGPDSTAYITVTSQNGKTKIWTIKMKTFDDIILGTWKIQRLWLYGGIAPDYSAVLNMATWDPFKKNVLPASKETDNLLTFTLEGALGNGDSYGTVNNDAGLDGAYADFIFIDSGDTINVNNFYRKIPKGISKWSKDVSANTITFTPLAGGSSTTLTFVETGTYKLDTKKSITIADKALVFDLNQPANVTTRGKRRNYAVDSPQKFYIEIQKQSN